MRGKKKAHTALARAPAASSAALITPPHTAHAQSCRVSVLGSPLTHISTAGGEETAIAMGARVDTRAVSVRGATRARAGVRRARAGVRRTGVWARAVAMRERQREARQRWGGGVEKKKKTERVRVSLANVCLLSHSHSAPPPSRRPGPPHRAPPSRHPAPRPRPSADAPNRERERESARARACGPSHRLPRAAAAVSLSFPDAPRSSFLGRRA
jgi:hypothetical protein